ncbi:hypothetical protein [Celeribacter sp.]|uniref:capsular polysaccharide export protein, LipB/KpsS family n=1 Tax=Celeribacter sp. TaxID=1890673 RepID=UPI003A9504CC
MSVRRPLRMIYIPAGRPLWFDLAQHLADAGVAEPVLWLGDGVHDQAAKAAFPDAEVVNFKSINFKRRVPRAHYAGQFSGFWTSPALHEVRDHAIKLMDRSERFGPTSGPEREAYFIELCFWAMSRIVAQDAEVVLMAENPHSAPSYVLYALAGFAGLEVLVFSAWPLAPVVTLRRGLWSPDLDIGALCVPREAKRTDLIARFRPVVAAYVARFENPKTYAFVPRYMQIQAGRDPLAGRVKRLTAPLKSAVRLLKPRMAYAALKRGRLYRSFVRVAENAAPKGPYVYFPLHYEPERTTNPDGGLFHDQLRALAQLRALVPAGISICVKEHPSQFNARMMGHQGRTARFYHAVQKVEGVHLVRETVSSAELTLGAEAVATITGTVALEAAILGRRALIFGRAWFEGCPNVTRFDPALDWDAFQAPVLKGSTEICDWLCAHLAACGLPACVNPSNAKYFAAHYADGTRAPHEAAILADAVAAALETGSATV